MTAQSSDCGQHFAVSESPQTSTLHASRFGPHTVTVVTARFSMVSYTNHTWPIIGVRNGYFDEIGIKLEPPDGRIVFENQTVPLLENKEVDVSTIFVGVLTPVLDKIKDIRP